VVGDIGDISQPQCHKYTKKQKKYCERERRKTFVTLWLTNVTQVLLVVGTNPFS